MNNLAVYINSFKYHYTHIASTYIERGCVCKRERERELVINQPRVVKETTCNYSEL